MKTDKVLINHEKIHHQQQKELLILPFYFLYLTSYFFNLVRFRNHQRAYREIVFEREAYAFEQDLYYLNKRALFSFLKHLS